MNYILTVTKLSFPLFHCSILYCICPYCFLNFFLSVYIALRIFKKIMEVIDAGEPRFYAMSELLLHEPALSMVT